MTAPSLPDFLLARIAQGEWAAKTLGAHAMIGWRWKQYPREAYEEIQAHVLASSKRTLATCAAHREIIRIHVRDWKNLAEQHGRDAEWVAKRVDGDWVLCALASIYADHPDWRPEWKR